MKIKEKSSDAQPSISVSIEMSIIGIHYKLMNKICVCVRVNYCPDGMRYELYRCFKSFGSIIRIVDVDGELVSGITHFDNDLRANENFDYAIKLASL
jgi:hypothetical protein